MTGRDRHGNSRRRVCRRWLHWRFTARIPSCDWRCSKPAKRWRNYCWSWPASLDAAGEDLLEQFRRSNGTTATKWLPIRGGSARPTARSPAMISMLHCAVPAANTIAPDRASPNSWRTALLWKVNTSPLAWWSIAGIFAHAAFARRVADYGPVAAHPKCMRCPSDRDGCGCQATRRLPLRLHLPLGAHDLLPKTPIMPTVPCSIAMRCRGGSTAIASEGMAGRNRGRRDRYPAGDHRGRFRCLSPQSRTAGRGPHRRAVAHASTSYTLPAVATLALAREARLPGEQVAAIFERRARHHWAAMRFYRRLGRMLFDAAAPRNAIACSSASIVPRTARRTVLRGNPTLGDKPASSRAVRPYLYQPLSGLACKGSPLVHEGRMNADTSTFAAADETTGPVEPMPTGRSACVIGSGFGGLALVIRLQSAGIQTTVVEARDKPGAPTTGSAKVSPSMPDRP